MKELSRAQLYLAPAFLLAGAIAGLVAITSLDPGTTGPAIALSAVLILAGLTAADHDGGGA